MCINPVRQLGFKLNSSLKYHVLYRTVTARCRRNLPTLLNPLAHVFCCVTVFVVTEYCHFPAKCPNFDSTAGVIRSLTMDSVHKDIYYSDKYYDDTYEYRLVRHVCILYLYVNLVLRHLDGIEMPHLIFKVVPFVSLQSHASACN